MFACQESENHVWLNTNEHHTAKDGWNYGYVGEDDGNLVMENIACDRRWGQEM